MLHTFCLSHRPWLASLYLLHGSHTLALLALSLYRCDPFFLTLSLSLLVSLSLALTLARFFRSSTFSLLLFPYLSFSLSCSFSVSLFLTLSLFCFLSLSFSPSVLVSLFVHALFLSSLALQQV